MAYVFAATLVVALAITPEVKNDLPRSGGSHGALPIAHEFLPRYSALQSADTLPELQAPRYADRPQWAMGDGLGDASEPLQPRSLRALLPPLRSVPPARVGAAGDGSVAAVLAAIKHCESRGDYTVISKPDALGQVYYGAYQFLPSTWRSVGGVGLPSDATPEEQDYRATLMVERGRRGEWGC